MKIKHHSIFKELSTQKIDWSKLRINKNEKGYYLPNDFSQYLEDRNLEEKYDEIINNIENLVNRHKIDRIISLGSGVAALEYHLKKKLKLKVEVSDCDNSINILDSFKIFDKVFVLDLKDNFKINCDKNTLILLSRVDTELSDEELKSLFYKLYKLNINYIYFIPAQVLNFSTLIIEIKTFIYSILLRKKLVLCGYSRSKLSFASSWNFYYKFNFLKNTKDFFIFK